MARKQETTTEQVQDKGPDYFAYHVRSGDKGKTYWTRLGAAWAHKDGKGFSIDLEVMPVSGFNGRIVVRAPADDAPKSGG